MGALNLLGSDTGSLTEKVLIPAREIRGFNSVKISDFSANTEGSSRQTRFTLQASNDNFISNIVDLARLFYPDLADGLMEYRNPIFVRGNFKIRVVYIQGVVGVVSASIHGETANEDILDI